MIDVHIHVVPPNLPGAGSLDRLLQASPDTVAEVVRGQMQRAGVTHAFAMGEWNCVPEDPLGIRSTLAICDKVPGLRAIGIMDPTCSDLGQFERVEKVLQQGVVVALKGYLGYLHYEPAHENYRRYYDLAAKYRVPVIFHTGDTYSPKGKLRYSHPLGVDEVAVDHPDTRFVMAHVGNPWMIDCAQVIYKNINVWCDLPGLMLGNEDDFASPDGRERIDDIIARLRAAFRYAERPNRFLYGTDWPLAPMLPYRDFIAEAILPEYHDLVFEENARVLFRVPD
jgi:predicted TIM-barrel fold metal-dependent hydrolase